MKTFLFGFCLCLSLPVAAQTPAPLPGHYTAVVEVPGATQADLYVRVVKWLTAAPIVPETAVRDAASGLVSAREHSVFVGKSGMGGMRCTLWRQVSVEVKDGRARYDFSGFQVQYYVPSPAVTEPPIKGQTVLHPMEELTAKGGVWGRSMQDAADEATAAQVASLKAALLAKSDW